MNTTLKNILDEFATPGHGHAACFIDKISPSAIGTTDELERLAAICLELKIYGKAAESVKNAIELSPSSAKLHFLSGLISYAAGDKAHAIASYERALALDDSFVPALVNMADILWKAGKLTAAAGLMEKALSQNTDDFNSNLLMGNILNSSGESVRAVSFYKKAAALSEGIVPVSNMLMAMHYSPCFKKEEIAKAHFEAGRVIEKRFSSKICPKGKLPDINGRKIRIGYLSADFRRHSIAYFIEPVIYRHDHEKFEIFCYYDNPSADDVTARFRTLTNNWRDTAALSDDALAGMIRSDSIDILIDLAGHTGKRIPVLAMRPAPVMVLWMGYASTTGLESVDYFISDRTADPPGNESLYTEKIVRIDGCSLCFAPPAETPELVDPPFVKNNLITFGCMNNFSKINSFILEAWLKILQAVPSSVLLLKNKSFNDSAISARIRKFFTDEKIDEKRIILRGFEAELTNHLALYNKIDIALDTFPYNGVTTTCEALWMGVPVITLKGDRYSENMGSSLLKALHLNAFISENINEYIAKAVNLAKSHDFLIDIRKSIRPLMASSSLCDSVSFTAALEEKYIEFLR
ncbi:MAG: hypothetical protein A2020_15150 [Lentisphaerae bacterium GWF2_45_14]|nr:MAG: hypothetical protein A2020_15150 [Lentisphaerae bacterium GWF2_45_14]